jgi:uncharacterized protein
MTQPAKVQEPSMEEILASIRRIIADDEAKPVAAEKAPPAPASPPPAAAAAPPPKTEKPAPAPPPARAAEPPPRAPAKAATPAAPPPTAAPSAPNNQDDIDALLNGLDDVTIAEEIRPAAPEPEPEPDVLELTDEMALQDPQPQPAFRRVEPPDDLEFTEAAARAPVREPAYDLPPPSPIDSPAILSRSTVSAVESAFNSLAHTVLSNNARTLEDLVKEMLRPMLKSWLDDNLPGLVERIVKAEIDRVSRGR